MGNSCTTHGQPMGNPWATHAQPMGNPCATHGQHMEDPWASLGLPPTNPRATVGIPCPTREQPMGNPWGYQPQPMGNPWTSHCQSAGVPRVSHGQPLTSHDHPMGTPWATHALHVLTILQRVSHLEGRVKIFSCTCTNVLSTSVLSAMISVHLYINLATHNMPACTPTATSSDLLLLNGGRPGDHPQKKHTYFVRTPNLVPVSSRKAPKCGEITQSGPQPLQHGVQKVVPLVHYHFT